MLTIHLENEGRSARLGLSATPAEKAVAPLEQMTPAGKVKRVQALNGQTPLPAPTPADLIDGDPELDLEIAGRLMRDATAVYLEPGTTQPSIFNGAVVSTLAVRKTRGRRSFSCPSGV